MLKRDLDASLSEIKELIGSDDPRLVASFLAARDRVVGRQEVEQLIGSKDQRLVDQFLDAREDALAHAGYKPKPRRPSAGVVLCMTGLWVCGWAAYLSGLPIRIGIGVAVLVATAIVVRRMVRRRQPAVEPASVTSELGPDLEMPELPDPGLWDVNSDWSANHMEIKP